MKRSRFTEEQIIGILKEHEAGVSVSDLCRKHGVSDAKHLQMESQVWRHGCIRGQEDENGKLKRLLADAMLDNVALKDYLEKNGNARCGAGSCRTSQKRT